MIKYSLSLTVLVFSLALFAQSDFIKLHPKGMPGFKTSEGKQEWVNLIAEFKKTGEIKLISLALDSPREEGLLHAEKSLALFDMLKARPNDFMKANEKEMKNFSCLFHYLIPDTQFIPFSDLDEIMATKKDPNPFREKAKLYFKNIKDDTLKPAGC